MEIGRKEDPKVMRGNSRMGNSGIQGNSPNPLPKKKEGPSNFEFGDMLIPKYTVFYETKYLLCAVPFNSILRGRKGISKALRVVERFFEV